MTTAMAELLALVALDKATLHPPLLWPVDKVVRILIGLVALGTASLPIALFIGRTRRAAINVANARRRYRRARMPR